MYCRNCGSKLDEDCKFCTNCGVKVDMEVSTAEPKAAESRNYEAVAVEPPSQTIVPEEAVLVTPKKHKRRLFLGIGAAVVVMLAVVALAGSNVFSNQSAKEDIVIYCSDNKYKMLKGLSSDEEPILLADPVVSEGSPGWSGARDIQFSADGKYVYFIAQIDKLSSPNCGTLYRAEISSLKAGSTTNDNFIEEIDNSVQGVREVLKNGSVLYLKNDGEKYWGANTYLYDGQESKQIVTGLNGYSVSEDESYIIYRDIENDLYYLLLSDGNTREKLATSIVSWNFEKTDTMLYTKQNENEKVDVYRLEIGGDNRKILSDIDYIDDAYSADQFYYVVKDDYEISLYDLVDDTYPNYDNSDIKMPNPDVFVSGIDYYEYQQEYDEWEKVNKIIQYREELKAETVTVEQSSLYFYKNGESTLISDGIAGHSYQTDAEHQIVLYQKIKNLNHIYNITDASIVRSWYEMAPIADDGIFYKSGSDTERMLDENPNEFEFYIRDDELLLVLFNGLSSDEIVSYKVINNALSNRTTIAEADNIRINSQLREQDVLREKDDMINKLLYYYTNRNDPNSSGHDRGDLYCYTVGQGNALISKNAGDYYVYKDDVVLFCYYGNPSEDFSTLMMVKNGIVTPIADNVGVLDYGYTSSGQCIAITDHFELYLCNEKEKKQLATGVECFWCSNAEIPIEIMW